MFSKKVCPWKRKWPCSLSSFVAKLYYKSISVCTYKETFHAWRQVSKFLCVSLLCIHVLCISSVLVSCLPLLVVWMYYINFYTSLQSQHTMAGEYVAMINFMFWISKKTIYNLVNRPCIEHHIADVWVLIMLEFLLYGSWESICF